MRTSAQSLVQVAVASMLATLSACGGGGGDGVSNGPGESNTGPVIEITSPASGGSEVCNSVWLGATVTTGSLLPLPAGTKSVTWKNLTSGLSGNAFGFDESCGYVGFLVCISYWRAEIPLVLGANRLTLFATDITGGTSSETITVNKPAMSYRVTGMLRTAENVGVGYSESGIQLQLSGGAAQSSKPSLGPAPGTYEFPCITDGSYTITPATSGTFEYAFQPQSHGFTVAGADVPDLDFQTTAYAVTGTIRQSNGTAASSGIRVEISDGGKTWSWPLDESGVYRFVVPNGTYTVTPRDAFCPPSCPSFNPPAHTVVVNNAGLSGLDFVVQFR